MTTQPLTPPRLALSSRHFGDLDRLRRTSPMYDAVVEEIDGRRIRIGDQWLVDFASCNYLGFDLDPEIIDAVGPMIRKWGTHPSWSRLLGNPRPYLDIEDRLTALLGAPDTLVLPTISQIHATVIPVLAGQGAVFMDAQAHKTIYDGCSIARGRGATLARFAANDPWDLELQLRMADPALPRVVCMDGVNSMTGNMPDLPTFAQVCRAYDAILYVDDAHGFGVIGEHPDPAHPYGLRGNSIVRHFDESYDNIVLVGGFSKAYSSLLAFLALPTEMKNLLKVAAPTYLYSGPVADRLVGDCARGDGGQRQARRRGSLRPDPKDRQGARHGASARTVHAEHLGSAHHRAPVGRGRRHRRGGGLPVLAGHLRHVGGVPAGPAQPGRVPGAGDCSQHQRGDRTALYRPDRAGRAIRDAPGCMIGIVDEDGRTTRVRLLAPLAFRDFRLLWTGMTLSLLGDGVLLVALVWQAYELSNRPAAMSLVGAALTIPQLVLVLFGGVISDRVERRRLMLGADLVRGASLAVIAWLSISGELVLWHLVVFAAVYGCRLGVLHARVRRPGAESRPSVTIDRGQCARPVRPTGDAVAAGPGVGWGAHRHRRRRLGVRARRCDLRSLSHLSVPPDQDPTRRRPSRSASGR